MTGSREQTVDTPCNRDGCGRNLICRRPDCPLVLLEPEPGLHRLRSRAEWVAELKAWQRLRPAAGDPT